MNDMMRQEFIRHSLYALSASATGLSSTKANAAPTRTIRIAIKYDMIKSAVSVHEKFQILKHAGFHGVEMKMGSKGEIPADELRRAVDDTGVLIHGLVYAKTSTIEEEVRYAGELGADSVLIAVEQREGLSGAESIRHYYRQIEKALPFAEKNGIRILVENVRASFLNTPEMMAAFIDGAGSPIVGSYFDTGNAISWSELSAEQWIRVLGKRIVKLDIKDRGHPVFGDPKKASSGVVGTNGGEVHWRNVRKELANIGFSGWATAEMKGGDRNRLAKMAKWVNEVLGL
jgi:hexulose-6-phosphate isomerase